MTRESAPEDVRGFDARTGRLLWTFRVMPRPGEFGGETWPEDAWTVEGAMGSWAPISADEELGYVYIGLSAPNNSRYGGHRPGTNLFSNSLVCLDVRTGERVWHYQLVHHDLWDADVLTPVLGDITVNGSGDQERDFVYVEDIARANLLALTAGECREYNLGSGTATSVNQIFQVLRELTGYEKTPLYGPAKQGEVFKTYLDSKAALKDLGWIAEIRLEDGLARTVESFGQIR